MNTGVEGGTRDQRCWQALAYLMRADVAPNVKEAPRRLQALIRSKGHHWANALFGMQVSRVLWRSH